MYAQRCATNEVTVINHVTMDTVHIFDLYHWTNTVATLHIFVPLHLYYIASMEHISTSITQTFILEYKQLQSI